MDDKSLREDEILAIKSIYEEEDIFSYDDDNLSGNFFVKFESPTQFQLLLGYYTINNTKLPNFQVNKLNYIKTFSSFREMFSQTQTSSTNSTLISTATRLSI